MHALIPAFSLCITILPSSGWIENFKSAHLLLPLVMQSNLVGVMGVRTSRIVILTCDGCVCFQHPHAGPPGGHTGPALRELSLRETEESWQVSLQCYIYIYIYTHTCAHRLMLRLLQLCSLLFPYRAVEEDVVDKDQILLQKEAEVSS